MGELEPRPALYQQVPAHALLEVVEQVGHGFVQHGREQVQVDVGAEHTGRPQRGRDLRAGPVATLRHRVANGQWQLAVVGRPGQLRQKHRVPTTSFVQAPDSG